MKNIRFRGISIFSGEWVYGLPRIRDGLKHGIIEESNGMGHDVKLKTITQWTGLTDKNGKRIFNGDIIGEEGVYRFIERDGWEPSTGKWKIIGEKTKNFTGKGEEKYIAGYELRVVEWLESSCGFEPFSDSKDNCGHCGGGINSKRIEVIGNIYEDKELLK